MRGEGKERRREALYKWGEEDKGEGNLAPTVISKSRRLWPCYLISEQTASYKTDHIFTTALVNEYVLLKFFHRYISRSEAKLRK